MTFKGAKTNALSGRLIFVTLFLALVLFLFTTHCKIKKSDNGSGNGGSKNGNNNNNGYQYPANYSFVEVPNPLSGDNPLYQLQAMSVPEIGKPFKDYHYSTKLTRVTQINGINGRHEYSRFDPFNKDKSMIVLLDDSGDYNVYKTNSMPYNSQNNFVRQTNNIEDPRWDNDNPNLLWGLSDFKIVRDNITTGSRETIKDFAADSTIKQILDAEQDIYRITMRQEGEASHDRRFWAFILQGSKDDYRPRYIFCWDRQENKIIGIYSIPAGESEIDWVGMSVNGNWVLIGGMSDNSGNLKGLTMANKQLSQFHRIDYSTAHSDVGLDINGSEVIVMQNSRTDYIDLIPLDLKTKPILEPGGSYEGTNRIPLVRLYYDDDSPHGFSAGVHISCNTPGYCVVSTHITADDEDKNWLNRAHIIIKLAPNNPRAFYLAKVYNTYREYWEETHGTITKDGSRIVWASNWNQDVGLEKMFLMQLDMPPNWKSLLDNP
jgi:hypothetical protein